jgi:hypothetical protein
MIVNAGTFQYQGDKRAYYRSTQAHNTLQIEGQEQSEVWGEHRVARRIKNVKCDYRIDEVHAECTTYYGNRLCRELQVGSHKIRVRDHVEAELGSKVMSYIHIAPEFGVNRENSEIVIKEGDCQVAEICLENVRAEILHDGNLSRYAPEFGLELTGTTIVLKWKEDSNHHGYTLKIGDKENG